MSRKPKRSKTSECMELCVESASKSEISIQDLPDEITLKILRYLDWFCLVHSISLVCKVWNKLAFDRSLWGTTVHLNIYDYKKEGLENIINKFYYVQHLVLENGYIGEKILREISKLTNLKSLSISFIRHSCFPRCSKFCEIFSNFNQNHENNQDNHFDLKQVQQLKFFKANLSIKFFTALLNKCSNVQEISLDYGDFMCVNDYKVMLRIDAISSVLSDTLESFHLNGIRKGDCLEGKCLKLKKLRIKYCPFYSDKLLFEIMKLSNLIDLYLGYGYRFTSGGIGEMFKEGKLSNLITLKLEVVRNLDNLILEIIANNCQNLQVFYISDCDEVTDEGVSFIVKECSKITDLSLKWLKNVKGSFLLEIKDNNLKNLRSLEVDRVVYESKYATSLRKARLELNIIMAPKSPFE